MLKEQGQNFLDVFEKNSAILLIVDTKTQRIIAANPVAATFYGYSKDELQEKHIKEIDACWRDDDKIEGFVTNRHRLANGELRDVEIFKAPVILNNQLYAYNIIQDVTQRVKAEKLLRNNEIKIQAIFNQSFQFMCLVSLEGNVLTANQTALNFVKVKEEDVIGKPFWDTPWWTHCKKEQQKLRSAIQQAATGKRINYEAVNKNPEGDMCILDFCINPIRDEKGNILYLCNEAKDITHRKEEEKKRNILEKQLYQAQKMEVIGTLAGGIAHDFNNILGGILGFAELALEDIDEKNPARYSIQQITQAGLRAKELVKQILLFSRQNEDEMRLVKVTPLIIEVCNMLHSTLPKNINLHSRLQATNDLVLANPNQLQQILMNLCTNAAHAMAKSGGTLSISLKQERLIRDTFSYFSGLRSGQYLMLEVQDTGHGIPENIRHKIFDPFFTTKSRKEGTGLGLAVVHGIVKSHGGDLAISSIPDEGTLVTVCLPLTKAKEHAVIQKETTLPKGRENILFVDDEPLLIEYGKQMLERLGYQVTAVTDSRKALEIFQSDTKRYHMLITDREMPHLGGLALSEQIRTLRPDIPIIMCTGFNDLQADNHYDQLRINALIHKPILKKQMAETIRSVLNGTKG